MYQISANEAKTHLSNLIDAAIRGEEVLIKNHQWIVRLVPVEESKWCPRFGSARGLIEMANDFDAPLVDFEEYMS
ncbi:MAG: type II toxin-antitoxin system prevent-host-death family antitoxin [bacterium]